MATIELNAFNQSASWLVLDIETGNAPDEAIQNAMESWKPPSNYKDPYKIEAKRAEDMDKIKERAALLDASPILCVAIQTPRSKRIFHSMGTEVDVNDWQVIHDNSEKQMLIMLREWLDLTTDYDTVIVGHNVKGFDLPKLRNAYIRHRLELPALFAIAQSPEESAHVVDTAQLFKAFSMQHRNDFCPSIDDMAVSFGLPRPKSVFSGADVPRLHVEGRHAEIVTYCAVDVATTTSAYLLMTGQYEVMQ